MRDGFAQHRINVLTHAMRGSAEATARLVGMKIRVACIPPRVTKEHMPFQGHRTCAQWSGPNRRGSRALKPKR